MLSGMLEYTFFGFRVIPDKTSFTGVVVWSSFNTAVRLGAIYLLIRVTATAISQGSFL